MSDPYSVLGISPIATDEQVREAYKKMAVKYSTEDYADSSLGDVAAQKMAEIDAAFDQIMSQRRVGDTGTRRATESTGTAGSTAQQTDGDWRYQDIREYLRRGDVFTAEQRLLDIGSAERGAEWNYLMGGVCRGKGWLDEARRYYSVAMSMDPGNREYAAAYNQLDQQAQTGQGNYQPYGSQPAAGSGCGDSLSSCCSLLCCMSLCNNCCCGGR